MQTFHLSLVLAVLQLGALAAPAQPALAIPAHLLENAGRKPPAAFPRVSRRGGETLTSWGIEEEYIDAYVVGCVGNVNVRCRLAQES